MTLLFTEGFESVVDDTDITRRGWMRASATNLAGAGVLGLPSRTSLSGRGLMLRGPYSSAAGLPNSGTTVADFGMINTKQSVYGLWQLGGFSFGTYATFNKASVLQIAPGDTMQIAYDGAQYYWAICILASGTIGVAYSTDLMSWTVTGATPSGQSINSTIAVAGSGSSATIIVSNKSGSTSSSAYYSTNMGVTWTAMSVTGTSQKTVIPTGISAAPYLAVGYSSAPGFRIFYYSSLSAAPTMVSGVNMTGSGYGSAWCKISNGYFIATATISGGATTLPISGTTSYAFYCPVSADPTVAANWTALPSYPAFINDMVRFKNNWVGVGYGGIYINGSSTSNAWVVGSGVSWSTTTVWSIAANGSMLVAVGQDPVSPALGAIYTSADGLSWTKQNRFILSTPSASNGNGFSNVTWDGQRFVITGATSNNVVATSTDGIAWTPVYYPDHAEATGASASMLALFSGSQSAAGVYTPWGTASGNCVGAGFVAGAISSNSRTITAYTIAGNAALTNSGTTSIALPTGGSANAPASSLTHFYELIATATATPNTFTVQWALDGVILGTIGTLLLAPSTDTGASMLFINLPRTGNWVMIDDLYLTSMAGGNNAGQLGPINVLPWVITGDAQVAMTPSTASTSNAALSGGPLSNSEGYVSSLVTGAQDVYNASVSIPANYSVCAVQAEAYFTKNGIVSAQGKVGVVNNGKEADSSTVTALATGAPTFASVLLENDPNTNTAWTKSGVTSAHIAVTKAN
ncbi:hypothetical protein AWB81_04188 [Caballeronia arationis]|uniref:hypothetical protein n=1 Tax=Caballeronia arationis TaxID=1777142 RepID=UPI00074C9E7C|nr:hypothetical protein [Caballeronia arationis]SAK83219.1 hypothetical protein AWB81_04188 [Caballeronia arationis]